MKAEINKNNELVVTVPISDQFLKDVFCTAIETPPSDWFVFKDPERVPGEHYPEYVSVIVEDWGDSDQPQSTKKIGMDDLRRGIAGIISGQMLDGAGHANLCDSYRAEILRAIMDDDAGMVDANHADSIMQAAYFGHIVYG